MQAPVTHRHASAGSTNGENGNAAAVFQANRHGQLKAGGAVTTGCKVTQMHRRETSGRRARARVQHGSVQTQARGRCWWSQDRVHRHSNGRDGGRGENTWRRTRGCNTEHKQKQHTTPPAKNTASQDGAHFGLLASSGRVRDDLDRVGIGSFRGEIPRAARVHRQCVPTGARVTALRDCRQFARGRRTDRLLCRLHLRG